MDAPDAPPEALRAVLRELDIIGRKLGGHAVTINALEALLAKGSRIQSVMDIASGGGDAVRSIARWAKTKNLNIQITGVDLNPVMTDYATAHSKDYNNLRFITADAMDDALLHERPDVVTTSLFFHHLTDPQIVAMLRRMTQLARVAVVINDLHRHPVAYHAIRLLTRFLSKSYMVKYDAPMSVARAFVRKDLERYLREAGIKDYTLRWRWAWRWQLVVPGGQGVALS